MKQIKKILSCIMALSVAFGGICAQPAKAESGGQNFSSISPNTKKALIEGASVVGGAGVLACLTYLAYRWFTRSSTSVYEQSVLIVGGTEESRQKMVQMFSGELSADAHDVLGNTQAFIRKMGHYVVSTQKSILYDQVEEILDAGNINWAIDACDANVGREQLLERTKGKTLVIAILDSDTTSKNLQPLSEVKNLDVPLTVVIDENYVIDKNETTFAKYFENYASIVPEYDRRQLQPIKGNVAYPKYREIHSTYLDAETCFWNPQGTSDGENFYFTR